MTARSVYHDGDVIEGDCLEVMADLDAGTVDAIVTDPPYDLTDSSSFRLGPHPGGSASRNQTRGFMGKAWDGTGIGFRPETWELAFRVAKPGAHLLAFGGTRTVHRMTVAIEDAGWEIRDCLVWAYAFGFPKSLNVGKANDLGLCRTLGHHTDAPDHECARMSPDEWYGFGTALKPAWEPIVMARKPSNSPVVAAFREHGTGVLNIDGTRISYASPHDQAAAIPASPGPTWSVDGSGHRKPALNDNSKGRWPANVILTDPIFDGDTPGVVGGGESWPLPDSPWKEPAPDDAIFAGVGGRGTVYGDSGTYSRFFLIPKADRTDREPNEYARREGVGALREGREGVLPRWNQHPTVKPIELMQHLVRLVTPQGGLVLDPFLGSGTTAIACELEGFRWIGIEKEAEYVEIVRARLLGTQRGMGLVG